MLDADIRDYFGSIDHQPRLMRLVARARRRPSSRVLKLVRGWLKAGVMEEGREERPTAGTPQGGVISPLSNIYALHVLDATLWRQKRYTHLGVLVRYERDESVVMCSDEIGLRRGGARGAERLGWLKLELHPEKTGG